MGPAGTVIPLGYRPALDGMRAVAILSVIGYHAGVPWLRGGLLGVDLFFVLSGFLITQLLFQEWNGNGSISLRSFYLRRALRLLPALLVLLSACAVFVVIAWPAREARLTLFQIPLVLFYCLNWALVWFHSSAGPLAHAWSLSIEEQFYMLWPLLVLAALRWGAGRRAMLVGIVGLAAFSSMHRAHIWHAGPPMQQLHRVYLGLDTRADALLLGAAAALLWSESWLHSRPARKLLGAAGLAGWACVAVLMATSGEADGFLYAGGLTLVALSALAIILQSLAAPLPVLSRILETRALIYVGRISYGLYLWHYPVFKLLQANFPQWHRASVGSAGVLLTLVIAAASFRYVEQPFLRRKARAAAIPLAAAGLAQNGALEPVSSGGGSARVAGRQVEAS